MSMQPHRAPADYQRRRTPRRCLGRPCGLLRPALVPGGCGGKAGLLRKACCCPALWCVIASLLMRSRGPRQRRRQVAARRLAAWSRYAKQALIASWHWNCLASEPVIYPPSLCRLRSSRSNRAGFLLPACRIPRV